MLESKFLTYINRDVVTALRLYPAIPANSHIAIRNTVLPVGGGPDWESPIFVPAGTTVAYRLCAMHHLPSLSGGDASDSAPRDGRLKKYHGLALLEFILLSISKPEV